MSAMTSSVSREKAEVGADRSSCPSRSQSMPSKTWPFLSLKASKAAAHSAPPIPGGGWGPFQPPIAATCRTSGWAGSALTRRMASRSRSVRTMGVRPSTSRWTNDQHTTFTPCARACGTLGPDGSEE